MITMAGHDRVFEAPRAVRMAAAGQDDPVARRLYLGQTTLWDMLSPVMASVPGAAEWCARSLTATLDRHQTLAEQTVECPEGDCEDTGFYGIADEVDPDLLTGLVRRIGDGDLEYLVDGTWTVLDTGKLDHPLEVLSLPLAQDLADALVSGGSGLMRRFCMPKAFLPPASCYSVVAAPESPTGTATFAVVDALDTGAVLDMIRIEPGPVVQRYENKGWVEDKPLLTRLQGVNPPPLVELDEAQIASVTGQIDQSDLEEGASAAPSDQGDRSGIEAAALVADAPLTVSPDPRAEKLRRYWSTGKGAAKIRWGTPGDWKRCFRHLSKYMGARARGYCQNLHKRNTGLWTGDRLNAAAERLTTTPGAIVSYLEMSTEENLVAAVAAGSWVGEGVTEMSVLTGIRDGVYREVSPDRQAVAQALTAGAYPVRPPAEWFEDPKFKALTPLTVEDTGQVYGHLADFSMPHIGLPGSVKPPRSSSGYAYFKTGQRLTADGSRVRVGNLTLVGGHASMNADAGKAVAHYDNTQSAVADVNVGEDRYGIWFAGALRPGVTEEQVVAFQASALSGDWRPINGRLEMVACCSVNVPGYPIAACAYRGGAITALVAAGAGSLYELQTIRRADAAMADRLAMLEQAVFAAPTSVLTLDTEGTVLDAASETVQGEPVKVPDTPAELFEDRPAEGETAPSTDTDNPIARARAAVRERRAQALRDRVHGGNKT